MPTLDLTLEFADLTVELLQVLQQPIDQESEATGKFVAGVLDQIGHSCVDVPDALGKREAELDQQPADLVGLSAARVNEALAHRVQCEHRLLLRRLGRDEAHVRPADRFADGLGIECVVLVGTVGPSS